jgi:ribosomal protein S18 acetylase RimI-like enzyme
VTAGTERGGEETLVPLAEAGSEELLALSVSAGWNQTAADWALMLARGWGWGLRDQAGALVASTLVLPYAPHAVPAGKPPGVPFAWISMVLVLPSVRERGLATRLLRVALEDLRSRGLAAVLDATPAGRAVYLKQGFADGWGFVRWRRAEAAAPTSGVPAIAPGVRPLRESDWPAITALDAPAFGADRLALLQALASRWPAVAWVVEAAQEQAGVSKLSSTPSGKLAGYLLGREGRTAAQIGPLVAIDARAALALVQAAVAAAPGVPLVLDLRDGWPGAEAWLRANGFKPERPFTRMTRGLAGPPGDAGHVALVAGPELG